jgi:hypothetical protein
VNIVLTPRMAQDVAREELVLRSLTVLAVDRRPPDAGGESRLPIVTFLMTPAQAQELISAQNAGLLRIVVSGSGES